MLPQKRTLCRKTNSKQVPSGACASLAGYLWLIQTHARTHPRTQARTHHCGQLTGSAGLAYMAAWAHNSQLACQLANSHVKSPANLHTEIKLHMAQDPLHMTQDPLHARGSPPRPESKENVRPHTAHSLRIICCCRSLRWRRISRALVSRSCSLSHASFASSCTDNDMFIGTRFSNHLCG